MKIVWLVNGILPQIAAREGIAGGGGATWLVSVLDELLANKEHAVTVLFTYPGNRISGRDGLLRYASVSQQALTYSRENEGFFAQILGEEAPDVIHIWGTEYPSTLAMVRAAQTKTLLNRTVISIQGLCSVYAGHYAAGLSERTIHRWTLRDLIRRDNIVRQIKSFQIRGVFEQEALKIAKNVIGRTDWDRACAEQIHPGIQYFPCNETLRAPFYTGQWSPENCRRHTLFLPQSYYPVKGTHYALEALAILKRAYPDVRLMTTGSDPRDKRLNARLRRSSYGAYLASRMETLGLNEHVEFLGTLNAEEMKTQYLQANVCISPSTVENSPNGVGEAMLLGVPTVSSFVGGVSSILTHEKEGLLYPADAPYLLAAYADRLFLDDDLAKRLSQNARLRAAKTHHPEQNFQALTSVYQRISEDKA